jgi:hypothetical protein
MQEDLERLKTALRVLAAVTEFRAPEEADMQALRSYAPLLKRRPADELAREVIWAVLKARGRLPDGMAKTSEGALRDAWFGPAKQTIWG